jgi:hypothetical protein
MMSLIPYTKSFRDPTASRPIKTSCNNYCRDKTFEHRGTFKPNTVLVRYIALLHDLGSENPPLPIYTHVCNIYIHICTYVRICMHIHTHIHSYMYIHSLHTYMHAYIHTYIHACMHARIHAHTHVYIHTRMHAYTRTRMHARTRAHTHMHAYIVLHPWKSTVWYVTFSRISCKLVDFHVFVPFPRHNKCFEVVITINHVHPDLHVFWPSPYILTFPRPCIYAAHSFMAGGGGGSLNPRSYSCWKETRVFLCYLHCSLPHYKPPIPNLSHAVMLHEQCAYNCDRNVSKN